MSYNDDDTNPPNCTRAASPDGRVSHDDYDDHHLSYLNVPGLHQPTADVFRSRDKLPSSALV